MNPGIPKGQNFLIYEIEVKLEDLVFLRNFIYPTFRYTKIFFSRTK